MLVTLRRETNKNIKAEAKYRFFFLFLVYHDNQARLLLPNHSPEVFHCLVQRMLGSDVTPLTLVILFSNAKEYYVIDLSLVREIKRKCEEMYTTTVNTLIQLAFM